MSYGFMRASPSGVLSLGVWSCFGDPKSAAPDASVFWHRGFHPHVVPVRLSKLTTDNSRNEPFDMHEFKCDQSVLRAPGGFEHVVFRRPNECVQLIARGRSVFEEKLHATYEIEGLSRARNISAALRTLASMKASQSLNDGTPHAHWSDTNLRLRDYLLALDGSLNGATYRQIALVIHGPDRVKDEWTSESRSLKERMRRAVEAGREYMNGGYRKLLT